MLTVGTVCSLAAFKEEQSLLFCSDVPPGVSSVSSDRLKGNQLWKDTCVKKKGNEQRVEGVLGCMRVWRHESLEVGS